jgi:glycosyltransferase involved in cell wall biosynthesis
MRNICFINTNKSWGGGEKWHYENSRALSGYKEKYNIFFVSHIDGKLSQLVSTYCKEQLKINIRNLSFLNIFKIINLLFFIRKNNIETLIINQPNDLKILGIVGRLARVKNIIYRRGSAIGIKDRITNRLIFRYCIDKIIANSNETKKTININNPNMFPENKIVIIYNGINIEEIEKVEVDIDIRKEFEIEKDVILIGNVGRLSKQKGHIYLFDSIKKVKETRDDFVVLLIGTGEEEEKLKAYAKELEIEKNIRFLGFREDVYKILKQVDFLVHTALWEGFGYVIVESLACGKPVVSTNVSNIPEILNDERYGYLAKDRDIIDISNKIISMIEGFKGFKVEGLKLRARDFDFEIKIKELEGLV